MGLRETGLYGDRLFRMKAARSLLFDLVRSELFSLPAGDEVDAIEGKRDMFLSWEIFR